MKVLSGPDEERAFRVCPPNERELLLDEIIRPAIGPEGEKKLAEWIGARGSKPNTQYFWVVSLLARKVRDEGREITLETIQEVAERVRALGSIDYLLIR